MIMMNVYCSLVEVDYYLLLVCEIYFVILHHLFRLLSDQKQG